MNSSSAAAMATIIFLYGPPGSGKSTNGQLLANSLALPFVDLDQQIEKRAGTPIPEIFDKEGESRFRQLEREQLRDMANLDWGVIALGGGALLDPANRALVEAAGPIICLTAHQEELLERLNSTSIERPLLVEGKGGRPAGSRLVELLVERDSHYASFENQVDTVGKSPQEIVWEVQTRLGAFHLRGMSKSDNGMPGPGSEWVRPHPVGYDVRVKYGVLDDLGYMLKLRGHSGSVALVADENVGAIYLNRVLASLQAEGYQTQATDFPPGESSKTLDTVSYLWQEFLEGGLERNGTVVALGGGVVGDLAGFAAATYLRGGSWVTLPTSLLAMVDASLGGKTGADLPQGKNLIGAFHAPQLVLTDPGSLDSLPQEELSSGMAEVIKAGIIGDPILFEMCSQGWQAIESNWNEIIRRAMAVKIRVIEADPYEGGLRAVLNLGHTIGHAVELVSNYDLRHGEAVSIGMVAEAKLAEEIGLAKQGLADQIADMCSHLGLPTEIPEELSRMGILEAMQVDKKRAAGVVRFSLPKQVGDVQTGIEITNLDSVIF
jgi:3-dehydroquinate synthase